MLEGPLGVGIFAHLEKVRSEEHLFEAGRIGWVAPILASPATAFHSMTLQHASNLSPGAALMTSVDVCVDEFTSLEPEKAFEV